jgi:hypothetical protein
MVFVKLIASGFIFRAQAVFGVNEYQIARRTSQPAPGLALDDSLVEWRSLCSTKRTIFVHNAAVSKGEKICWALIAVLLLGVLVSQLVGWVQWGPIRLLSFAFTSFPFVLVAYALRKRRLSS